uniref:DNA-directed RNA polymerase subunit beta n=1 Tax=Cacopsylla melanoneura TaxID=428564 RepID=A0A8D8SN21_9HEMI
MRTFHTGGVASFTFTKSMIVTNNFGYVYFKNCKCLLNYKNELIILNNFSFLIIKNFNQQENYKLSYGEKILIRNGIFFFFFFFQGNEKTVVFSMFNYPWRYLGEFF